MWAHIMWRYADVETWRRTYEDVSADLSEAWRGTHENVSAELSEE